MKPETNENLSGRTQKPSMRGISPIPQPKPYPIVGNAPDVGLETPIQSMIELALEYGPIFRLDFPSRTLLVLSSNDLAEEVCDESRFDKSVQGPLEEIQAFAGNGLFSAETKDPEWEQAHRILMPAFGPAALRNTFDSMLDIAEQMFTKWERLGPEADIDVVDNMTRLTLDTIALCGFGYRFNSFYQREMHPFVDAMVRVLAESSARTRRISFQTQLMILTRQQYSRDIEYMNQVVDTLIAERRKDPTPTPTPAPKKDLLGLMLSGQDPLTGATLSDLNIRYQMVTFLIAGHETTSGLLSFTLYFLLKNPEILRRARSEVERVMGNSQPRFEHLSQLGYLDQIFKESLRIWPTAPAFGITPKADTILGGKYPVKKGDSILVLLPMLHRDPAQWPNPETFDPDRFAPGKEIPAHSWKPFGNGQRACIGRGFSIQEATLVLAMALQRFDLFQTQPYDLVVKETLTLKPEGLFMRARKRQPQPSTTHASQTPTQTPQAPAREGTVQHPRHGTPLWVLYGSNSGSSENFARRIATDSETQGYTCRVSPLDEATGNLPKEGGVIIVASSYNGAPADNGKKFMAWLEGLDLDSEPLASVQFAVFGCGNRDWASTYQAIPKRIDVLMSRAGARRLLPRGEADAKADFFGDFENWYTPFWNSVGKEFGLTSIEPSQSQPAKEKPLYRMETLSGAQQGLALQHGLKFAELIENRELVDFSSPAAEQGKSKRHFEFKLPDGMKYQAGDYLAILPENPPIMMERVSRRFQLDLNSFVILHSQLSASVSLPINQVIQLKDLLGRYVELSVPATRKQVELIAASTKCPPEKAPLAALAADPEVYRKEVLEKRVNVLDLLERYASCDVPFESYLQMLVPMKVRQYSISSSPTFDPTRCSLTIAIVDAPSWSGFGRFQGTCSTFLANLKPGAQVAVATKSPGTPFRLPTRPETPVIMIGAGTGLAPFRGFIQERAGKIAEGTNLGEGLFFFGCDHPDVDFLYRDELANWEAAGAVSVLPAFFKAPRQTLQGEVMFVQHRLWEERKKVIQLLELNAQIYVCGDGKRMAPAVRETLERIYQDASQREPEEARAWLEEMERNGRYVADVFA